MQNFTDAVARGAGSQSRPRAPSGQGAPQINFGFAAFHTQGLLSFDDPPWVWWGERGARQSARPRRGRARAAAGHRPETPRSRPSEITKQASDAFCWGEVTQV